MSAQMFSSSQYSLQKGKVLNDDKVTVSEVSRDLPTL
jgi:hypothetical protein